MEAANREWEAANAAWEQAREGHELEGLEVQELEVQEEKELFELGELRVAKPKLFARSHRLPKHLSAASTSPAPSWRGGQRRPGPDRSTGWIFSGWRDLPPAPDSARRPSCR